MNEIETLVERNRQFATMQSAQGAIALSLPDALPHVRAVIIGCADMRVDPAHMLGLEHGEAVVIRNIGGRVTPGLLEQLGMLGRIGQVAGKTPGGGGEFHIVILQHTDCGIKRLANDPEMLTSYLGIAQADLASKSVGDPKAAVAVDVDALRAVPGLPGDWLVSGLVYDVQTKLVEVIVPPAPLAS